MTHQPTTTEKPKYFDLDIRGIGYLNRVREVVPENGSTFLAATLAALRGAADDVQYTYFDCIVVGEEAKDISRQLVSYVEADMKVLVGFHLSDLEADPFLYTSGTRAGLLGASLKTRLLRYTWVRVNGQPFVAPLQKTRNVSP